MAEAVLYNIASEIINKLGSLALVETGRWRNLEVDLESLKNAVSTIQAVLLDADRKFSLNQQVEVWLRGLKEAIYDADDLLDDFATDGLSGQAKSEDKNSAKELLKGHVHLQFMN
ncbi:putative disease resistance RPP13-like protein 1 isoform X4 [Hevea brasiliensis]|uniref:putative disease resistance RPP13-like protein 1 isoform X4 n=1 Tax=Hevea brasiliensis TaxID=3981 RepID=UPI000B77FD0B|nr:putative disease resistance RPP13-like protein 1 isoform X4 [Hevea brasiliensis]